MGETVLFMLTSNNIATVMLVLNKFQLFTALYEKMCIEFQLHSSGSKGAMATRHNHLSKGAMATRHNHLKLHKKSECNGMKFCTS